MIRFEMHKSGKRIDTTRVNCVLLASKLLLYNAKVHKNVLSTKKSALTSLSTQNKVVNLHAI